jgi:uncharacterized protein
MPLALPQVPVKLAISDQVCAPPAGLLAIPINPQRGPVGGGGARHWHGGEQSCAPALGGASGRFGVGKTTMVGAISEVRPLRTEETLSAVSAGIDDTSAVEQKQTTTVAMDFGRITFPSGVVLYLFGTPGHERFWFMWDELGSGALGAVVLADTRRLSDSFSSVDYFERRRTPFVVAANRFDGAPRYSPVAIRDALDLDPDVPVVVCDARQRESVKEVLITIVTHALTRHRLDQAEAQRLASR